VCKNNILRCECCRWRDSEDPGAQTRDNNKKSRLLACKQQLATRWESRGARGVIDPIPFASSHFAPGAPEREKKKETLFLFFSFLSESCTAPIFFSFFSPRMGSYFLSIGITQRHKSRENLTLSLLKSSGSHPPDGPRRRRNSLFHFVGGWK
jgi:hypothetical protein